MHRQRLPVDMILLAEFLGGLSSPRLKSMGGVAWLTGLTDELPRKLLITHYVKIVREKSLLRQTIGICTDAAQDGYAPVVNAAEFITSVQAKLYEVLEDVQIEPTLAEQSASTFDRMMRQRSGEQAVFVPTGVESLDQRHGGFAIGEMTVIAARPGIGKSSLLRQGILANCLMDNFCHLFSLEMASTQVLLCLWSLVSRVPFSRLRHPDRMTETELVEVRSAMSAVAAFPLKIDDSTSISATDITTRARITKRKHNTKLLGVDYLQKLRYKGRSQDRHTETTDAMVALTGLAKEGFAMVLLSSLTEGDSRGKGVPTLDNLRGSGDIKFEANTAYLLHREMNMDDHMLAPETLIIGAKARSDRTGMTKVYFDGKVQRFMEQDEFFRGGR